MRNSQAKLKRVAVGTVQVGLDLMLEADMSDIRAKSEALCSLFASLVAQQCSEHGFQLASPPDPSQRGSQICFSHPEGYAIMQARPSYAAKTSSVSSRMSSTMGEADKRKTASHS